MYNAEKKLEWIADAEKRGALSNRSIVFSHLDRLEDAIEARLDADIYDLMRAGRKAEAIRIGNQFLGFTTYSTARRFAQTVNAYLDWRFITEEAAIPIAAHRFAAYEFSMVDMYQSKAYIKSEDELAAALSQKRIEDGELLSVFASLAWLGYTVKEMVSLRQSVVDDAGALIRIGALTARPGFVNDTLLYYSRTSSYIKGAYHMQCVKEDGEEFVRNIVPANTVRPKANMQDKIQNMAAKYKSPITDAPLSYQQLIQAGKFNMYLRMEEAGLPISAEEIQRMDAVNRLTSQERYKEYMDFKTAIGK